MSITIFELGAFSFGVWLEDKFQTDEFVQSSLYTKFKRTHLSCLRMDSRGCDEKRTRRIGSIFKLEPILTLCLILL